MLEYRRIAKVWDLQAVARRWVAGSRFTPLGNAVKCFVPTGTPDNSPPIHRWVTSQESSTSPVRDERNPRRSMLLAESIIQSVVPDGTFRTREPIIPPINRWAIVDRPCRDCHVFNRHLTKNDRRFVSPLQLRIEHAKHYPSERYRRPIIAG